MKAEAAISDFASEIITKLINLEIALSKYDFDVRLIGVINTRIMQLSGRLCSTTPLANVRGDGFNDPPISSFLRSCRQPAVEVLTRRERAALALTEVLMLSGHARASVELHCELNEAFSQQEVVDLSVVILTIASWNNFGVAFQKIPSID